MVASLADGWEIGTDTAAKFYSTAIRAASASPMGSSYHDPNRFGAQKVEGVKD